MRYILFLLLTINCYSDVLRLTLDSRLTKEQIFTASRVQSLYNTYILDRGLTIEGNILNVDVCINDIDGSGGELAETYVINFERNFLNKYVAVGNVKIELDEYDINSISLSRFSEVLTRELAYCFGFQPIIWPSNRNIYAGLYIGQMALGGYREDYNASALFVPIDGSNFDEMYMPDDLMSKILNGSYISKSFWGVLSDNGNILHPNIKCGYLASVLPRRPVETIIINTNH